MAKNLIDITKIEKMSELVVQWGISDSDNWREDFRSCNDQIGDVGVILRVLCARLMAEKYIDRLMADVPKLRMEINDIEKFVDNVLESNLELRKEDKHRDA
jgi:hypothetical protein